MFLSSATAMAIGSFGEQGDEDGNDHGEEVDDDAWLDEYELSFKNQGEEFRRRD